MSIERPPSVEAGRDELAIQIDHLIVRYGRRIAVDGLTLLYSILIPSSLAAGILGFFTTYILAIVPDFHSGTEPYVTYFLGGPDWSLVSYWGSLGIYTGTASPLKSLLVAAVAAMIPAAVALILFVRKAF